MRPTIITRSQFLLYFSFGISVIVVFYVYAYANNVFVRPKDGWLAIYILKAAIETISSIFAVFYIAISVSYKKATSANRAHAPNVEMQNVAIAYLCCDDLEYKALESIAACAAKYRTKLVLHDDSSEEYRCFVDSTLIKLKNKYSINIDILRRSDRSGGKPGAVNNVLNNLPKNIEFLLLCDNDSFLPQNNFLEDAISYFDKPDVAVVQFRNVGHIYPADRRRFRILSESIDFYDVFVSFMDRFGWSPFLGHNALLRVSAMRSVGGFTDGQLADDIDYSVKIRLQGYTIRYAREIIAGERHPLTYGSLRKRTHKWTYGCTQILMRWSWAILTSCHLSLREKISFFLTVGYYHFQIFLLAYLIIFYVCIPFHDPAMGAFQLIYSTGLILFFTFAPSITYFTRNNMLARWPRAVLYWGFVYGSQDFVILTAAVKCLLRRRLGWVPTNSWSAPSSFVSFIPEILFAGFITCACAILNPVMLLLPTTVLFVGKFLAAPYLNAKGINYENSTSQPIVAQEGQTSAPIHDPVS